MLEVIERDYEVYQSLRGPIIRPGPRKQPTYTFYRTDFAWVAYDIEFMFRLCCLTGFDYEGRPLSWSEVKYCLPKG